MVEKAPVFDTIKKEYLLEVASLGNREHISKVLGVEIQGDAWHIPFFNRRYTVTPHEILDDTGEPASHAACVILCKYLLLCPTDAPVDTSLVTYKDFKDAAPYVGGFRNTASQPIAKHFQGSVATLGQQCAHLGGRPFATDVSCDLAFEFTSLPQVPIVLLFNDADEEFPSQATLLFQKTAAAYLDMECLAMVGATLAIRLKGNPTG